MSQAIPSRRLRSSDEATNRTRLADSAMMVENGTTSTLEFHRWWSELLESTTFEVERIPFARLRSWHFRADTGNLVHDSGRFFGIEGLRVDAASGPVPMWTQPIINQPEVGILGLLIKEIDGVLHCLVQAKVEPGNINALQISPTVQATRSNYLRVHGGEAVPYLEYFTAAGRGGVLVDVLQSEQGAWFYRKRNRNMVIEVTEDVPLYQGYRWLTLGQLRRMLAIGNMVNMDTRTVFACIPFDHCAETLTERTNDPFKLALARSLTPNGGALHTTTDMISWFTEIKTRDVISATPTALNEVRDWRRTPFEIEHDSGKYFSVMAVEVRAGRREIAAWTQPLFAPRGLGVVAFLAKKFSGVLHVLAHARVEPGYLDHVELAPTVQCTPENYSDWIPAHRPPFMDDVLNAEPASIRFDVIQSEEGGRFFQAENRYLVVEVDTEPDIPPNYLWLTIGQLTGLLGHSHYLNVQARSLVACLNSLW